MKRNSSHANIEAWAREIILSRMSKYEFGSPFVKATSYYSFDIWIGQSSPPSLLTARCLSHQENEFDVAGEKDRASPFLAREDSIKVAMQVIL